MIRTAADLAVLLADQLRLTYMLDPGRPKGRQELTCAQDVADALHLPQSPAPPFSAILEARLGDLINIPVIVSPDSAPGTWQLRTHDHCEVIDKGEHRPHDERYLVSHQDCTLTAEGILE